MTPPAEPETKVEELRAALSRMLGAERRLRGRDHSRSGALTYGQIRTIAALGREREMTVGQLAKHADLTPATVTVMLDHLEAANIVARHRSAEDRRVCNVSLTPEGWELLDRKAAAWQAMWVERLSSFSESELDTALQVIEQIAGMYDSLATRPDEAAESAPAAAAHDQH
jgi:DNA-binding MarR family transcriptional regulator